MSSRQKKIENLANHSVEGRIPTNKDDPQSLDNMLIETARDWSQFVQVDTSKHDTAIQDISEDLMMRLDEFETLLDMSKDETKTCFFQQMPVIQEKYQELQDVFESIDNLKIMVDRIKSDMDKLDKDLSEAEATVETASLSGIVPSRIVPSLIGGAKSLIENSAASVLIRNSTIDLGTSSSTPSSVPSSTYQPVNIFRTEDFFPDSAT